MTLFDLYFEMLTLADARLINSRKAKVETRKARNKEATAIVHVGNYICGDQTNRIY